MAVGPTQTNYRPLGTTPGNQQLAREALRLRSELDTRIVAREITTATLPSSGTVEIRHGLRSVPQGVSVTCLEVGVRFAVTERTSTTVTVTNADPTETKIEVILF